MTQLEVLAHEERIARGKGNPLVSAVTLLEKSAAENACLDEGELHGEIMQHCKSVGWICFHGTWGKLSRRSPGEPDFNILADKGRRFLIECKTKSGKLSPEQLGMKVWADKLGHTIHTVRSLDEFKRLVEL